MNSWFVVFQVSNNRDYYTINTDDLDIDDLTEVGCQGNKSEEGTETLPMNHHSIITRIPSENCEIREIKKEEFSVQTVEYTDAPFSRRLSATPSVHNNLYPCTDTDTCIGPGFSQPSSRKISEQRISSSSDDVFATCKSCNQILYSDKGLDTPEMVKCPDCGLLNLRVSPMDIHVSERTDSAICSTASDDSDHSHGNKSDYSANSEEYLMPESPFVVMATESLSKDTESKPSNSKENHFNFEETAMPQIPNHLTFCNTNDSEYYFVLRNHLESVLLKQQLSDTDSCNIVDTKLWTTEEIQLFKFKKNNFDWKIW